MNLDLVDAKCPYFVDSDKYCIKCEGITDFVKHVVLAFNSSEDKIIHFDLCCCKEDSGDCPLGGLLNKRWEFAAAAKHERLVFAKSDLHPCKGCAEARELRDGVVYCPHAKCISTDDKIRRQADSLSTAKIN